MSVYKRGRVWWVKIQHDGKVIRRSSRSTSRSIAVQFERDLTTELDRIARGGRERFTLRAAVGRFLSEHLPTIRASTAQRYKISARALLDRLGSLHLDEVTRPRLSEFVAYRKGQKRSASTIRHDLAVLSKIYSLACNAWEWADANPVRSFDKSAIGRVNWRIRFLTPAEEHKLRRELRHPVVTAVALGSLYTGMRRGEVMGLRWTDFDWDRSEIYLKTTKGGVPRVVPMSDTARAHFKAQPRHITSKLVFCTPDGRPFSQDTMHQSFARAMARAKIEDFKFHDLRHTFATRFVQAGGRIERLQLILGHTTIQMTMRYAHLAIGDLHDETAMVNEAPGAYEVFVENLRREAVGTKPGT